ncbi:40s ribosomal protein s24 [Moniliophthora roreri]|nr:40s ribosomal protein s24 [Moniliophthora roreri]
MFPQVQYSWLSKPFARRNRFEKGQCDSRKRKFLEGRFSGPSIVPVRTMHRPFPTSRGYSEERPTGEYYEQEGKYV